MIAYKKIALRFRVQIQVHATHRAMCRIREGVNGGQWHERARSGPPGATSHRVA